jgi:hypothetical protein
MSIALRNLEENDFESVQALISAQAGPELMGSELCQAETLKACFFTPSAFTLVAADESALHGMVSILMEQETPETVIGLLTRFFVSDGTDRGILAASLAKTALETMAGNLQLCYAEIPASDLWAQAAFEEAGFKPCGFLPAKFQGKERYGAIVYAHLNESAHKLRRPHPEVIVSARDLATESLRGHGLIQDIEAREDIAAYPTECNYTVAPLDASAVPMMREGRMHQQSEIFPFLQGYPTRLHLPVIQPSYIAAKDGERVIGVMGFIVDPSDKRVQITEVIALDGEPQGFLAANLFDALTREVTPDYWEVLVSVHSPRMQKTFDQLGFVPCAYLPSFGMEQNLRSDAIKMVKLNATYESAELQLTSACKSLYALIDETFREQAVGMAVLRLLKDLRIFQGMGEGELRRVARLFKQKLYRPGEVVVEAGTTGRELYVVERGEIEIHNKERDKLLGSIRNGAVFGEIAFLNGEPRTATCVSKSASIVRVIERQDFDLLIQRELHLGRVFFQNVALDLADKLKQATAQAQKR